MKIKTIALETNSLDSIEDACIRGDVPFIEGIFHSGYDLNSFNSIEGENALHLAVKHHHFILAFKLLGYGIDPNAKDNSGESALHKAVNNNKEEVLDELIIQLLVKKGADPNAKDNYEETPLLIALNEDKVNLISILCKNGADPDLLTYGNTPLCLAVENRKEQSVVALIQAGADVNLANSYGDTPLNAAVKNHDATTTMIALLVKKGANIDQKDKYGNGLLHEAVEKDDEEMALILIQNGANINLQDNYGFSPLHLAVRNQNEKMMRLLISQGADINSRNRENDETPLHYALKNGDKKSVKLLIRLGANLNIPDNYGDYPIHTALNYQQTLMPYLLRGGIDINVKDCFGNTSLSLAVEQNDPSLVRTLITHGADKTIVCKGTANTPLILAIKKMYLECVEELVRDKALAKQLLTKRKLYLFLGEKIVEALSDSPETISDAGIPRDSIKLIQTILENAITLAPEEDIQNEIKNIITAFRNGVHDDITIPELIKKLDEDNVLLIHAGFEDHFIPALFRKQNNIITLTIIDSGPLWNFLDKKGHKAISAGTLPVSEEHLEELLTLLKTSKTAPEGKARKILLRDIPLLVGKFNYDFKDALYQSHYKTDNCHFNNLKRTIPYLPKVSHHKQISFFMRKQIVDEAKEVFGKDHPLTKKAQAVVDSKFSKVFK